MTTFAGFSSPNYTITPDELFDVLMPDLSGAELKVVLYIIRRTFGFGRASSKITIDEMLHGRRTIDGRLLDRGTGISSRGTLITTLRALRERGVVEVDGPEGRAKTYRLRFVDGCPKIGQQRELLQYSAGPKIGPAAGPEIGPAQDRKSDPHKTNSSRETEGETGKTSTAKPSGVRKPKSDTTWLTPFCAAWEDRFKAAMPTGPNLRPLADVRERLGEEEAVRRWRNYLGASGTWAKGAHFAATLGDWEKPAAPRRGTPGAPTHPDDRPAGDKFAALRARQAEQEQARGHTQR